MIQLPENPFSPLSFIAGPAILTNATAVLLNGASIRYNLAIGLWRDLRAAKSGVATVLPPYADPERAAVLARRRVGQIVRALNLLYAAMASFGVSTLAGLTGALLAETPGVPGVGTAKALTIIAVGIGLTALLGAAATFVGESRITVRLLRLGALPHDDREEDIL